MSPKILHGFSVDLPEDVIREEILVRLPVKSLLRFRAVCKSWHATILSLDFTNNHYHHQTNNTQHRHIISELRWVKTKPKSCFSVFSSNLERLEMPDYLELPGHAGCSIYGPCNGIFCIYFMGRWRDSGGLALWNPATRRLMPLPLTADRTDINQPPGFIRNHHFARGFGMDPFTHELKIVILDCDCRSDQFAVYKSSNKIPWMFKSSDKLRVEQNSLIISFISLSHKCVVFVNGFIYWMRLGRDSVILAFDLHNEVFEVIQMPGALQMSEAVRFQDQLTSYDDSLAIFSYHESGMFIESIDMWTMKEKGSWTKLPTLVLSSGIHNSVRLILCVRNKILVSFRGELLVYDPDSQSFIYLDKIGGDLVLPLMYYKESLASLKGDHELQDTDTMSDVSRKFFAQDTDSSDDDASDDSDSSDDESIWNTLRRWLF